MLRSQLMGLGVVLLFLLVVFSLVPLVNRYVPPSDIPGQLWLTPLPDGQFRGRP